MLEVKQEPFVSNYIDIVTVYTTITNLHYYSQVWGQWDFFLFKKLLLLSAEMHSIDHKQH